MSEPEPAGARPAAAVRIVPQRHYGRKVMGAVVIVLLLLAARSVATNPRFGWEIVGSYMFSPRILKGLWTTLWLTAVTMVGGYLIGTLLAAMRLSQSRVLQSVSWLYVWLFRSVPLLVLLLFWFNIAAVYPVISVPFAPQVAGLINLFNGSDLDAAALSVKSQSLISTMTAALLGLIMHEAAYAAEVIRGGIISVPAGQAESATALGFSKTRIFFGIVLPQAMKAIIPATGNNLIGMLKGTSIVSVLAVEDLLYSAQIIYNRTYEVIPLLLVATVWYIIITTILSIGQYYVERHYARGTHALPPTPLQHLRRQFARLAPGMEASK